MLKKTYLYKGPVAIANNSNNISRSTVSSYCWEGKTLASSPKEAINNLKYQYRRGHNMNTRVPLVMHLMNLKEEGD